MPLLCGKVHEHSVVPQYRTADMSKLEQIRLQATGVRHTHQL